MNRHIGGRSGEVDVVSETGVSGTLDQPIQRRAFVATGSAPDDNDDAMMWLRRCEMEKIVPVARKEYATSLVCKPENGLVGGIARKGFAQQPDIVTEFPQQIAQVVGDVMIEQEFHCKAGAICLATSKSISPRWSS